MSINLTKLALESRRRTEVLREAFNKNKKCAEASKILITSTLFYAL